MRYSLSWIFLVLTVPSSYAADIPEKYRPSVEKGLAYLAKQQYKDGHWSGQGDSYPTALTAFTGLAFIAEGSTPQKGKYADNLKRAAAFLIDCSQKGTANDGLIGGEQLTENSRYIFGHGYAMAFLATVLDDLDPATKRKAKDVLNRAVQFSAKAQTRAGGWGYVSAREGSNFDEGACTVSQIQGLHAARTAGIPVPREVLKSAYNYMKESTSPNGGVYYNLQSKGVDRPALTVAALAVHGAGDPDSPLMKKWFEYSRKSIPLQGRFLSGFDDYTAYHYAQAIHRLGDDGWVKLFPQSREDDRMMWSKFREVVFDNLIKTQSFDGSWSASTSSASTSIGPVFTTALHLTLMQLDKGRFPTWSR